MTTPVRSIVTRVAVVLGFGLSGQLLVGQEVALQYRWTKGEVVRYRLASETVATMTGLPTGDMTVNTTAAQVYEIAPEQIEPDGAATLRVKFESVKLSVGTPMGTMSYDTASPSSAADPMGAEVGKALSAVVGESISMVMAPNGAVRSVSGATRLGEKIKSSLSPAMQQFASQFSAVFTDEGVKGAMGQGFANLPDKTVKLGESWQSALTTATPMGTTSYASTLTLKGADRVQSHDVARIAVTQKITTVPAGGIGGVTTVFGEGASDGEVLFDSRLGRVVTSTLHVTQPMTLQLPSPDGTSLNVSSLSKSTVTLTLIER